jgi:hypothetical protein
MSSETKTRIVAGIAFILLSVAFLTAAYVSRTNYRQFAEDLSPCLAQGHSYAYCVEWHRP